MYSIKDFFT